MTRQSTKATLVRQWHLMELVRSAPQGRSMQDLMQDLKISQSTLDRDLKVIEEAGLPFKRKVTPEETRVLYSADMHSSLTNSPSGSKSANTHTAPTLELTSTLSILNEAIEDETEVHISYILSGTTGIVSSTFAPVLIHTINETPYLFAWHMKRLLYRLIAVARITQVWKGKHHGEAGPYSEEKTISGVIENDLGELITVKILIAPWIGLLVEDYPLTPAQAVTELPDGKRIISCTNVSTLEALRWVLSWGNDAQVIEPKSLRELVAGELRKALSSTLKVQIDELTAERDRLVQSL